MYKEKEIFNAIDIIESKIKALEERLEEATNLLTDCAYQFGYSNDDDKLHTGGLSTLEDVFNFLGWDDPYTPPKGVNKNEEN